MKIAYIYTGAGLMKTIPQTFSDVLGECEYDNFLDEEALNMIIREGKVTDEINERIQKLYDRAAEEKPDVIVCTCSSIGETCSEAAERLSVPVVRIDEAMAEKAVAAGKRIAVMATLESTVDPTCRLIERVADEQGKEVTVSKIVMKDVLQMLFTGKIREALGRVVEEAKRAEAEADVLLLAQASLDSAKAFLEKACSIPVFSSPGLCAESLKKYQ